MKEFKCIICSNTLNHKRHIVPEMMFGRGEKFEYIECGKCGCLQIINPLKDLSNYYPKNYYSFQKLDLKQDFILSFIRKQIADYYIRDKNNMFGLFLSKIFGVPDCYNWVKKVKLKPEAEILDVGCGIGHLLVSLRRAGYKNLTGVDAYIKSDIFYNNSIKIYKKESSQMSGNFDFITLNHCFEHMLNPLEAFKQLNNLLKPGGCVLIRVPVTSTYAWKKYGVNWVQLDAPRHIFIPTVKSIQILADESSFNLSDVVFDSWDFQFWGSEQYLKGIPLRSPTSYAENPKKSIFTKSQIKSFKNKAVELNKNNQGDTASFYFYKN